MITIEFSEADKEALYYERYNHPHQFVQKKMEVVWLKSQGVMHQDICRITKLCSTTVTTYLHDYQEGGIEALKILSFRKPQSDMEEYRGTLESYFRDHPPATAKEAMAVIEKLTGLKRSPQRVRMFMKRLGLKCRKVGMMPAKADIQKQAEFKKKSSNRVWMKPKKGNARFSSSMRRTSS
jgi:transposase